MSEPRYATIPSPFGAIRITVDAHAVTGASFLSACEATPNPVRGSLLATARDELAAYLRNPRQAFSVPLDPAGAAHARRVWQALCEIPVGQTRTYGQVAASIGSAPRAVGGACGRNPIPIFIPCHRVVAADRGLGGFMQSTGGAALDIKRWLLAHETRLG
jgi:methylated-DNA-[protein]-cysteine S-methyltransferase